MDTDETRLSGEYAVAISTLKLQLSGLSPPQVLTGARKGAGHEEGDINRRSNLSRPAATAIPGPAPSIPRELAGHSVEIGPGPGLVPESGRLEGKGRRAMRPTRP